MSLIYDTHTHLYLPEFNADRQSLLKKAASAGVSRFYLPNIDGDSIEAMLEMEAAFPEQCFAMMGIHPCSVTAEVDEQLALVRSWLEKRPFIGIGEIGLDLYWDKTFFEQQKKALKTQLEWALEFDYGVSIHCRNAHDELYALLSSMPKRPRAVYHCFSGNLEQAKQILDLGDFKLGIGGVVTFKNSGLDQVVKALPPEHLVLETDAPYLAPVPFRGKRNEPAYILEVARKVAELKETGLDELGRVTRENAEYIFKNR